MLDEKRLTDFCCHVEIHTTVVAIHKFSIVCHLLRDPWPSSWCAPGHTSATHWRWCIPGCGSQPWRTRQSCASCGPGTEINMVTSKNVYRKNRRYGHLRPLHLKRGFPVIRGLSRNLGGFQDLRGISGIWVGFSGFRHCRSPIPGKPPKCRIFGNLRGLSGNWGDFQAVEFSHFR